MISEYRPFQGAEMSIAHRLSKERQSGQAHEVGNDRFWTVGAYQFAPAAGNRDGRSDSARTPADPNASAVEELHGDHSQKRAVAYCSHGRGRVSDASR